MGWVLHVPSRRSDWLKLRCTFINMIRRIAAAKVYAREEEGSEGEEEEEEEGEAHGGVGRGNASEGEGEDEGDEEDEEDEDSENDNSLGDDLLLADADSLIAALPSFYCDLRKRSVPYDMLCARRRVVVGRPGPPCLWPTSSSRRLTDFGFVLCSTTVDLL